MRPLQVQYERLVSDRNYGNVKIGLMVELGPGDDFDSALSMMKQTVHSAIFWSLLNAGIDATDISIGEGCPEVEIFQCGHCCKTYPTAGLHPTETDDSYLHRRICLSCGQNAIAERKRREAAEQEEAAGKPEPDLVPVVINGEHRMMTAEAITYEQLVKQAFPDATTEPPLMTVTFSRPDRMCGSLTPGESLLGVAGGTIFNVGYTGNA